MTISGDDKEQKLYLSRLAAWEYELVSNANNMRKYAERTIKLLEEKISRRWPASSEPNEETKP